MNKEKKKNLLPIFCIFLCFIRQKKGESACFLPVSFEPSSLESTLSDDGFFESLSLLSDYISEKPAGGRLSNLQKKSHHLKVHFQMMVSLNL